MSHVEKKYTTSDLCAVVGINPANLRLWRNRYGLFPETRVEGTNKREWNRFSIVDICTAQSFSLLVASGFSGFDSANIADKWLRLQFMMLLEDLDRAGEAGDISASSAAICFGRADGRPEGIHVIFLKGDDSINYVREAGLNRQASVFVDLLAIIEHAIDQLLLLEPVPTATLSATKKIVVAALLKGLTEEHSDA